MIKSAGAWLYRWVLVFGLIKSCCGAKEAPPSAVGGLEGIDKRVGSWGKKKEKER